MRMRTRRPAGRWSERSDDVVVISWSCGRVQGLVVVGAVLHSVGAGYRAAVEGINSAVGTCLASAANRSSPGHTLGREGVCMHTLGASNPSSTRAGASFTLSAIKFLGPARAGSRVLPVRPGDPSALCAAAVGGIFRSNSAVCAPLRGRVRGNGTHHSRSGVPYALYFVVSRASAPGERGALRATLFVEFDLCTAHAAGHTID